MSSKEVIVLLPKFIWIGLPKRLNQVAPAFALRSVLAELDVHPGFLRGCLHSPRFDVVSIQLRRIVFGGQHFDGRGVLA